MPIAMTPAQVYDRADQVWHQQKLPPYIVFVTHVLDQKDLVRVVIRTSDGATYTETVPTPPDKKVNAAVDPRVTGPYGSPLGFCVSASHCSGILQTDPFAPAPISTGDQNVIAHVYAYADPYTMSFGPRTTYQDHAVIELRLEPRYDPRRYQLRDMLVDTSTFRIWQMTYSVPRPRQQPAEIRYEFGQVGPMWYLEYVCDWIPDPGGCGWKSTSLDEFEFPATAPPWIFDGKLWQEHEADTAASKS